MSTSVIGFPAGSKTGFAFRSRVDVATAGWSNPDLGGVPFAGVSVLIVGVCGFGPLAVTSAEAVLVAMDLALLGLADCLAKNQ